MKLNTLAYFNLGKKLTEATTGVHFEAFGQLKNELHDDGLMGHLLHQCMFLQIGKQSFNLKKTKNI